jgi:hypothetical protein
MEVVWVLQVCGVGLLPSGVAAGRAAAPASYYRGKGIFTSPEGMCSERTERRATGRQPAAQQACLQRECKTFRELRLVSSFIRMGLLSFETLGDALTTTGEK